MSGGGRPIVPVDPLDAAFDRAQRPAARDPLDEAFDRASSQPDSVKARVATETPRRDADLAPNLSPVATGPMSAPVSPLGRLRTVAPDATVGPATPAPTPAAPSRGHAGGPGAGRVTAVGRGGGAGTATGEGSGPTVSEQLVRDVGEPAAVLPPRTRLGAAAAGAGAAALDIVQHPIEAAEQMGEAPFKAAHTVMKAGANWWARMDALQEGRDPDKAMPFPDVKLKDAIAAATQLGALHLSGPTGEYLRDLAVRARVPARIAGAIGGGAAGAGMGAAFNPDNPVAGALLGFGIGGVAGGATGAKGAAAKGGEPPVGGSAPTPEGPSAPNKPASGAPSLDDAQAGKERAIAFAGEINTLAETNRAAAVAKYGEHRVKISQWVADNAHLPPEQFDAGLTEAAKQTILGGMQAAPKAIAPSAMPVETPADGGRANIEALTAELKKLNEHLSKASGESPPTPTRTGPKPPAPDWDAQRKADIIHTATMIRMVADKYPAAAAKLPWAEHMLRRADLTPAEFFKAHNDFLAHTPTEGIEPVAVPSAVSPEAKAQAEAVRSEARRLMASKEETRRAETLNRQAGGTPATPRGSAGTADAGQLGQTSATLGQPAGEPAKGSGVALAEPPAREYVPETSGMAATEDQMLTRNVARALKTGAPEAIKRAAPEMATRVPAGALLVPLPDSKGNTAANAALAQAIAAHTGSDVFDALTRTAPAPSSMELRQKGKPGLTAEQHVEGMAVRPDADIGMLQHTSQPIVFIDNVETTGATAEAARRVIGRDGKLVVYAKAPVPAGEQAVTPSTDVAHEAVRDLGIDPRTVAMQEPGATYRGEQNPINALGLIYNALTKQTAAVARVMRRLSGPNANDLASLRDMQDETLTRAGQLFGPEIERRLQARFPLAPEVDTVQAGGEHREEDSSSAAATGSSATAPVEGAAGAGGRPAHPRLAGHHAPAEGSTGGPGARKGSAPPTRELERVAPPRPPLEEVGGQEGREDRVRFAGGSDVGVRYRAIEAEHLQPSHHPTTFAKNPDYPGGIQGREYSGSRGAEARRHVELETGRLRPDILLDAGAGATEGPPVITKHGIAVAGNQRAMMIQRAIEAAPERAAAYREQLIARAAQFGLDPEKLEGMKNPVLVRQITDAIEPAQLGRLNQLSDTPTTKAKDTLSAAAGRAAQLRNAHDALGHFNDTIGEDESIRDYLDRAEGREFVKRLFSDLVFHPQERSALIVDDKPTEAAKQAIVDMLRLAAIGDADVIHRAPASMLRKLDSALPSIIRTNGSARYSLQPYLRGALELLTRVDDRKGEMERLGTPTSGFGVDEYVAARQGDIFGAKPEDPDAVRTAQWLEREKKAAITEGLRQYARVAVRAERESQSADLYGYEPETPEQARSKYIAEERLPSYNGAPTAATLEREADAIFYRKDADRFGRCTECANAIVDRFGGAVVGYWADENRGAAIPGNLEEGHDFAVTDHGRFIVDPWAKNVADMVDRAVLDLTKPEDAFEARRRYGDASKWEVLEGGEQEQNLLRIVQRAMALPTPQEIARLMIQRLYRTGESSPPSYTSDDANTQPDESREVGERGGRTESPRPSHAPRSADGGTSGRSVGDRGRGTEGEGVVRGSEASGGGARPLRSELPGTDAGELTPQELYRRELLRRVDRDIAALDRVRLLDEARARAAARQAPAPPPIVDEPLSAGDQDDEIDDELPLPPDFFEPAVQRERLKGTKVVDAKGEPLVVYYHTSSPSDDPRIQRERVDYNAPWFQSESRIVPDATAFGWTYESARAAILASGLFTEEELADRERYFAGEKGDRRVGPEKARRSAQRVTGLPALQAIVEDEADVQTRMGERHGWRKFVWRPMSFWRQFAGLVQPPPGLARPLGIRLYQYGQSVDMRDFGGTVAKHPVYANIKRPLRLPDGGAAPWTYEAVRAALVQSGAWTEEQIAAYEQTAAKAQRYRGKMYGIEALRGLIMRKGSVLSGRGGVGPGGHPDGFDGLVYRVADAPANVQAEEDEAYKAWIAAGSPPAPHRLATDVDRARKARRAAERAGGTDAWVALSHEQVEPAQQVQRDRMQSVIAAPGPSDGGSGKGKVAEGSADYRTAAATAARWGGENSQAERASKALELRNDGKSWKEIGDAVGVTPRIARRLYHRARAAADPTYAARRLEERAVEARAARSAKRAERTERVVAMRTATPAKTYKEIGDELGISAHHASMLFRRARRDDESQVREDDAPEYNASEGPRKPRTMRDRMLAGSEVRGARPETVALGHRVLEMMRAGKDMKAAAKELGVAVSTATRASRIADPTLVSDYREQRAKWKQEHEEAMALRKKGMSYKEIAEELGISLRRAWNRANSVVSEGDLFGYEAPKEKRAREAEDQTSLFGGGEGTEASRPLESAERAAQAEVDKLRQRALLETSPEKSVEIAQRIALLTKLVNRGNAITADELATEARARVGEGQPPTYSPTSDRPNFLAIEAQNAKTVTGPEFERALSASNIDRGVATIGLALYPDGRFTIGAPAGSAKPASVRVRVLRTDTAFAAVIDGIEAKDATPEARYMLRRAAEHRNELLKATFASVRNHQLPSGDALFTDQQPRQLVDETGTWNVRATRPTSVGEEQQYNPAQTNLFDQPESAEAKKLDDEEATIAFGSPAKRDDALKRHREALARFYPTTAERHRQVAEATKGRLLPKPTRTVRHQLDAARLMELLRDPKVERFSAFLLKPSEGAIGEVVGHTIQTSGALGFAHVDVPRMVAELVARAHRTGATKVMFGHNHPTGDVTPSQSDLAITLVLAQELRKAGLEFAGHVVINHGQFSWMGPINDVLGEEPNGVVNVGVPFVPHSGLTTALSEGQEQILTSGQAARRLAEVAEPEASTMLWLDMHRRVVAAESRRHMKIETIARWLPEQLHSLGAHSVIISAPRDEAARLAAAANEAHAAAPNDPNSIVARKQPTWGGDILDILPVAPDGTIDPKESYRIRALLYPGENSVRSSDYSKLTTSRRLRESEPPSYTAGSGIPRGLRPSTGIRETQEALRELDEKAEALVKKAADDTKKLLNPAGRGPAALVESLIIRSRAGEASQRFEQAAELLEAFRRTFEKLPEEQRWDFVDRMEHGRRQPTEPLEKVSRLIRGVLDSLRDQIRALGTGKLEQFIEHYFPHIWADPEKAQVAMAVILGKRPLAGPASFLKQRTIPTVREGRQGYLDSDPETKFTPLTSVSDNPLDLVLLKVQEMNRYLMGQRILRDMKEQGLAKYVPAFGFSPAGFVRIDDRIAMVYGPSEMALWEGFDAKMRAALEAVIKNYGFTHERKPSIGGNRAGFAEMPGTRMVTKFGGSEGTVAHELGHLLDNKFKFWERLVGKPPKRMAKKGKRAGSMVPDHREPKADKAKRKTIRLELRALADMRHEGMDVEDIPRHRRVYVRKRTEQIANMIDAYVTMRDRFKQVAPTLFEAFDSFARSVPELKPIVDVTPSVARGEGSARAKIGGLVVKGQFYAPEPAARILNHYLSPGMRGHFLYDLARGAGNAINVVQLGLSAFHLGFTTMDAIVSRAALGVMKAVEGKPLEAAGELATAAAAPFSGLVKGDRVIAEYMRPGSQGAEFARIVDLLVKGGGRVKMDSFYRVGNKTGADMWVQFWRHFRQGHLLSAGWRAPLAVIQALPHFILEHVVPRQKIAVFADLAEHELDRLQGARPSESDWLAANPGPDGESPEQATARYVAQWDIDVKAAMARVWNSVDNRMGQLVYDNLFWHRITKDAAMVMIRSVGWNLGTFRELGGGAIDLIEAPFKAAKRLEGKGFLGQRIGGGGKKPPTGPGGGAASDRFEPGMPRNIPSNPPAFTSRSAYLIALFPVAWVAGAVTQYLYTGEAPGMHDGKYRGFDEALRDGFNLRTGRFDADGNEERMVLPMYVKDILAYHRHPAETVMHKLQPVWALFADIISNKDFYGNKVRNEDDPVWPWQNPDDPWHTQLMESLKYAEREIQPFAVQNIGQAESRGQGLREEAAGFVGVTMAPREVTRTPAQQKLREYMNDRGHTALTPQKQEESEKRRELGRLYTSGGMSRAYLGQLQREGELTRQQAKRLATTKQGFPQRGLFDTMTPEEAEKRAKEYPLGHTFSQLTLDEAQHVFDIAVESGNQDEIDLWRPILEGKKRRASLERTRSANAGVP